MSIVLALSLIASVFGAVWLKNQGVKRKRRDEAIAGVCSGLAYHFDWDVTAVRIIAVILGVVTTGGAVIAYVLLWMILPQR